MKFTLVSTIFNEASRLEESLSDISKQSLLPTEVVIVDAGSNDGTLNILDNWKKSVTFPVKVIIEKGCNVAEGRNIAIKNAKYEIILSTDFGCKYHPDWMQAMIGHFDNEKIEVVGGNYTVLNETINSRASVAAYLLSNKYQFEIDDTFIPSSRSIAYKKYVWEKVGGYPEWLTLAADDYVFGLKFKHLNFSYALSPEPMVYWLRHDSFNGFAKESYRYGLGDGEADVNSRNFWSNFIETCFRYFLPVTVIFSFYFPFLLFVLPLLLLGLRSYYGAFRVWLKNIKNGYGLSILFDMLKLIEITRIYYIKGYLKGKLFKSSVQRTEAQKLKKFLS